MFDPSAILQGLRPDANAAIATLFRQGGDAAIESLAMGDGGWGRDETAEILVNLRETSGFTRNVDWQDLENLTLERLRGRKWSLREWSRVPEREFVPPTLASALLIRASGEPSAAGNDFWGLEGSIAMLVSAALARPEPFAREVDSLLAWRLLSPIEPPYGTRCFLWLALLVLKACRQPEEVSMPELESLARETLAADAAGGEDGLSLEFRSEGRRWIELLEAAKQRMGRGQDRAVDEFLGRIRERMGTPRDDG